MRADTPMPPRIAGLPRDKRGYPIPWNVVRGVDGAPLFTINDNDKAWEALRKRLCPICGERLGRWCWFVGGPRSAFDENGWYLDLPGHHECMQYSLAVCPYLAMPIYCGRVDVINPDNVQPEHWVLHDQTVIPERPEIFVAVATHNIEMQERGTLYPCLRPGQTALGYEFWRHGKQITLGEATPYLAEALGAEWKLPEVER